MIQYVNPEIGIFLSKQAQKKQLVGQEKWKVFWGNYQLQKNKRKN
jgi:hypothetical protein